MLSSRNNANGHEPLAFQDFVSMLSISIILLTIFSGVVFIKQPKKSLSSRAGQENLASVEEVLPQYVPGEVLVVFSDTVNLPAQVEDLELTLPNATDPFLGTLFQKGVVKVKKVVPTKSANEISDKDKKLDRLYKLSLKTKDKDAVTFAIEGLKHNPFIEAVGPNYIYSAAAVPNDSLFSQQWGLSQTNDIDINAPEAWDVTKGSAQTVVTVVDSGVYYNHPDLQDKIFINNGETGTDSLGRDRKTNGVDDDQNGFIDDWHGWDATTCLEWNASSGACTASKSPDSDALDDMGHGTLVSGIIGATTDNAKGIAGIDWNVKILPVKVLDRKGNGSCEDIIKGLEYVIRVRQFTPVVNIGFAGSEPCVGLENQIDFGVLYGLNFVAPAGNGDSFTKIYPAGFDNVFAVGAIDKNGNKASFSNYGGWIDIVSPGVDVLSTTVPGTTVGCSDSDNDGYTICSGTSMAAPFVSGTISLILSRNRILTPIDIKNILANSVKDLGQSGKDIFTGYGLVRAYPAVQGMNTNKAPIVSLTFPYDGVLVGSKVDIEATVDVPGFEKYQVLFAPEANPTNWQSTGMDLTFPMPPYEKRRVAIWSTGSLSEGRYIIRLVVFASGKEHSSTTTVTLSKKIVGGWPKRFTGGGHVNVADISGDGKRELIVHEKDKLWALDKFGNNISTLWPAYIPASNSLFFTNVASVGNLVSDINEPGLEIVASVIRADYKYDIYVYNLKGRVLPGWPKTVNNNNIFVLNNQPLADINSDGLDDIVYLSKTDQGQVLLQVRNGKGELLSGWENVVIDNFSSALLGPLSTPVVGEINGSPGVEIVVASDDGNFPQVSWKIKAYASSATKLWEYSLPSSSTIINYEPYVVLGDVVGDTKLETIVLYGREDTSSGLRGLNLVVLNQSGVPVAPFTPLPTGIEDIYGSLIIGDINKDKKGDIVVNSQKKGISQVFSGLGGKFSGFPIIGLSEAAFIAMGDINKDTSTELTFYGKASATLLQQQKGRFFNIYTYNSSSSTLTPYPNFELYFGYPSIPFSHAITDMDWDGKTELAVMVTYENDQLLYVFDPGASLGNVEWPMFFHDYSHTGAYKEPVAPLKPGDANMDGKVDGFDYVIWWLNFGKFVCGAKNGDFNFDCRVDGFDYVIWWLNFGK